jgi:Heterokaryon incompatibility protein (HET)
MEIDSLPEYEYEALPGERYFRLMLLLPGSTSDPVLCLLSILPLASVDDYVALSYAWGDTSLRIPMICNGRKLYITENLNAALIRLRHPEKWFCLWVDSICIDQKSIQDRNHQVRLMKHIYEGASQVFIWLGEADEETDLAWHYIKEFSDKWQHFAEAPRENPLLRVPDSGTASREASKDEAFPLSADFPVAPTPLSTSIRNLLQRSWFSRCWVVQEIVVSKAGLVVCGHRSMKWDTLQNACKCIMRSGMGWIVYPAHRKPHSMDLLRSSLRCQDTYHRKLINLLIELRTFESSDPRDKVFSIIGIAADGPHDNLGPDYGSDVREVFKRTMSHLIQLDENLQILSQAGSESVADDLPSWVPDWRNPSTTLANIYLLNPKWAKCFSAAGSSKPVGFSTADSDILLLRGFCLDKVSFLSSDFWFKGCETSRLAKEDDHLLQLAETLSKADSFLRAKNARKSHDESYQMAYVRTLSADYFVLGVGHFPGRTENAYWYSSMPKTFHCLVTGMDLFPEEAIWEWIRTMDTIHHCRKFFLTTSGWMGLCPDWTKEGDMVCLLLGGHVPFVLRPDGERYRFIGESYIHGAMDGEAMAGTLDEGFEFTDFVLQ